MQHDHEVCLHVGPWKAIVIESSPPTALPRVVMAYKVNFQNEKYLSLRGFLNQFIKSVPQA